MKLYESQMRIMQTPGHDWAAASMQQIPINTWNRDDLPFVFDSIKLTSFSIDPDWLAYTIHLHNPQMDYRYTELCTVTPALIGEIRVKSWGAPKRVADWIDECLINALCSTI